jgi:uncharacterized protein (DUF1800 family)
MSFKKYSGPWNIRLAAHLLKRTTYGVNYDIINNFGSTTLDECMDIIFKPIGPPPPPININYADDPDVPIGETWIDKPAGATVNAYRSSSLRGWTFELMLTGSTNIREKMTMFWHNHFVTADINDPRYSYKYIALLRANALGNFKQLTKDITIDPAMLEYLNGRDNTKQAPNENYARELMELFTLGKGTIAGPGDYTTYTEDDVKEVAKILTGWTDARNTLPVNSQFNPNRHDTTVKKLSPRFSNASVSNAGAEEYKQLIDLIFQKEEVSLFIARKLYRWFLHYNIDTTIEQDIIIPLAKEIKDSNYDIEPALRKLLSSEHFYSECIIGGMIKNPIDFLLNPLNQFSAVLPDDLTLKFRVLNSIYQTAFAMQMGMYQAPSVAGWQAYYQEPTFYRLWLNATSLPARKSYADGIASNGIAFGTYRLQLNAINTLNKFANPSDPDEVINEFSLILISGSLADNQKATLKSLLYSGSALNTWTPAYIAYKSDPTNEGKKTIIVNRLKSLIVYMMRMPEYHLS